MRIPTSLEQEMYMLGWAVRTRIQGLLMEVKGIHSCSVHVITRGSFQYRSDLLYMGDGHYILEHYRAGEGLAVVAINIVVDCFWIKESLYGRQEPPPKRIKRTGGSRIRPPGSTI